MPRLLVSVRSAVEARLAWTGGASIIDVKEPANGPLGRAPVSAWLEVREAVPERATLSLALGDLSDPTVAEDLESGDLTGFAYLKIGFAAAPLDWVELFGRLVSKFGPPSRWVAVGYSDWVRAQAPPPREVLTAAVASGCSGFLVDSWDKSVPSNIEPGQPWLSLFRAAREAGLVTALAGSLSESAIARLAPLEPDIFGVRGAACREGDRWGEIDPHRVSRLIRLVESLPPRGSEPGLRVTGNVSRTFA